MTARDGAAVCIVAALLTAPLWQSGRWQSADEVARERAADDSGPRLVLPWTPSPEVEAGLFALQAGLGAGILGYLIGVRRGRPSGKD